MACVSWVLGLGFDWFGLCITQALWLVLFVVGLFVFAWWFVLSLLLVVVGMLFDLLLVVYFISLLMPVCIGWLVVCMIAWVVLRAIRGWFRLFCLMI